MLKHTHRVTIAREGYTDTFFFTPSQPDAALKDARDRVSAERGDGYAVAVVELPTAADTRARGRMVEFPPTANSAAGRRGYVL